MPPTQANRQFAVTSVLGQDVLLLQHMAGREGLSTLFEFNLDMLSTQTSIAPSTLLGTQMTVSVELPAIGDQPGGTRYFNGYVTRFAQTGGNGDYGFYRATLRPWLWLLTQTADCRIFQNMSIPDVLSEIFKKYSNISQPTTDFTGNYSSVDYCVQYRETDFNFVSRLMEHEGIYYYFDHDNGNHTLVLTDDSGTHATVANYDKVPFYPPDRTGARERDHLSSWEIEVELRSGKFTHNAFDFTKPQADLTAVLDKPLAFAGQADHEIYDFPGYYVDPTLGATYAKVRLEELQSQYRIASGGGDARGLEPGALFTLTNNPVESASQQYLIVSASYAASNPDYLNNAGGDSDFHCSITAMDAKQQFRPPRVTPKPFVQGPQTAMVVGKSGEEIWTDQYGRVKVQFNWDRLGKKDENSSCWLRVAQIWAGKSWGGMFIPRIGQEVIVDFFEGDPDQPIITGRVYNAVTDVPYPLPANQTRSTIKSNSSKGGNGSNELRFEDLAGSEEVYIHAQKDMNTVVENDETETIKHDQTITVTNNRTETVQQGDESVTISKGKRTVTVSTGDDTHTISQGNRTVSIAQGNDELTVSMGNLTIKVSLGEVSIQAMQSITLQCGPSSIKVSPTGVTISGPQVQVSGDAMVQVQAPVVMIN